MDSIFILRLVLSFLIAGGWVAGATFLAEKWGSKIGGMIANLPSNILVSMLFVAVVQDTDYVAGAMPAVPVGMMIDTVFLLVMIVLLKRGLFIASSVSLGVWLVLALLSIQVNSGNFANNLAVYAVVTAVSFYLLERIFNVASVKEEKKSYSPGQIALRAVFAGSVVTAVIIISKFAPPLVTGIIATFPAILLTTMIILTVNQNAGFAQATGKIMVLTSSNIVVYSIGLYFTYPTLGIVRGTIISFAAAVLWVFMFHPLVDRLK